MSAVKKRSVSIRGHQTSFSVEEPFYDILHEMAAAVGCSLAALIVSVDEQRPRGSNLSSALRLAALEWVKQGGSRAPVTALAAADPGSAAPRPGNPAD